MLDLYISALKESIGEIESYFAQKADGRHRLTNEEQVKANNQAHQIQLLEIFGKMENYESLSLQEATTLKQAYWYDEFLLAQVDAYPEILKKREEAEKKYSLKKATNLFGKNSFLMTGKENLTFHYHTGEFATPTVSNQSSKNKYTNGPK